MTNTDNERQEFEDWAHRNGYSIEIYKRDDFSYNHADTEDAWQGWLARAKAVGGADGWRTIESAPPGSNGIAWMMLAWGPEEDRSTGKGMRIGQKFYACGVFYCLGAETKYEMRGIEVHPTHWMPLPSPPKEDGE